MSCQYGSSHSTAGLITLRTQGGGSRRRSPGKVSLAWICGRFEESSEQFALAFKGWSPVDFPAWYLCGLGFGLSSQSKNHKIFWARRDSQGSWSPWSPTLKKMAYMGFEPTLLAPCFECFISLSGFYPWTWSVTNTSYEQFISQFILSCFFLQKNHTFAA